ncbi:MAG: HypC/HybG/HupF family hydrogenase formation chaperone [Kiritimatiellae bacterium]|nr:HypC/HybG/HupF family hydrogenase formation chaperone [Kiritimatiellia bacterium]MDD5523168.1 HypC/HybG/HupF family hydrogenase formation chaperone [Kiritimatiellia bacterium]
MCLAIPMKLTEVRDDGTGIADIDGAKSEVNLTLLDKPEKGNYVIIHAGFAIEILDEKEANERIKLFEELGQLNQAGH